MKKEINRICALIKFVLADGLPTQQIRTSQVQGTAPLSLSSEWGFICETGK